MASLWIFLISPPSTRPGPTSTYVVTPSDARRRTTASHSTGDETWRTTNNGTYDVDFCDRLAALTHFEVRLDRMPAVVERVIRITRAAYPDLRIPYHSRWRHFTVGSVAEHGPPGVAPALVTLGAGCPGGWTWPGPGKL